MARRNKKKSLPRLLLTIVFSVLLTAIVVCSVIIYRGYKLYESVTKEVPVEQKIDEIRNMDNYTKIDEISNYYKDAVIAVEDHRFYSHKGIDLITTISAAINNIKTNSLGQGGSTITQQLAKNMYFSQEKKFTRKVAELFVSFELENKLSKDEILELYMNIIYFGDGYYGINDASHGYYHKAASDLELDEAIMLAGLPAAPSVYSPNVNKKLAGERYEQVKKAMLKYGFIEKGSV